MKPSATRGPSGLRGGGLEERISELIPSRRRRRRFRPQPRTLRWFAVLLLLATLAAGYVAGMSAWQSRSERFLHFWDFVPPRAIDVLVIGWFFFIGSSIGSFLNVVAWRMPRGCSIRGRSHCPFCDAELGWRENWPVFGWIVLAGRCRTCRLPISPRYPIVEAAVASTVVLVAWSGLYRDAPQLPFWPRRSTYVNPLWMPMFSPDALAVIFHQVAALGCVWAFALVRFDSARLPRSLVAWCFALVAVPMLAYPLLAVVPWTVSESPTWTARGQYLNAAMRVLTGLACGVLLARILARAFCPTADPKLRPLAEETGRLIDVSLMLSLVGVLVGWQATVAVVAVSLSIAAALPAGRWRPTDPLARWAIVLPAAVAMQLAFWASLHQTGWWPSVNTAPWVMLIWAGSLLVLPRLLQPPSDQPVAGGEPALAIALTGERIEDDTEQADVAEVSLSEPTCTTIPPAADREESD